MSANSFARINAAQRALIAFTGQEGAAATIGDAKGRPCSQQRISHAGRPENGTSLPVDEIFILEDVAGRHDPAWPPVTRALASLHGYDLVKRRDADPAARADWLCSTGRFTLESGGLASNILEAISDGTLTADECARIVKDVDQIGAHLAELRAMAVAHMGGAAAHPAKRGKA